MLKYHSLGQYCDIVAFVKQVEEKVSPEEINGSGEDGLACAIVTQAAIVSLQEGRIVKISEIE